MYEIIKAPFPPSPPAVIPDSFFVGAAYRARFSYNPVIYRFPESITFSLHNLYDRRSRRRRRRRRRRRQG